MSSVRLQRQAQTKYKKTIEKNKKKDVVRQEKNTNRKRRYWV
jgi:hypothetical protein